MAFADLDNLKDARQRCTPNGVLVTTRECGPPTKRIRFLAVLIGRDLAKALNFAGKEIAVKVSIGNGQDDGKLRIAHVVGGQFCAKRQMGGGWLVTVRQGSLSAPLKAGLRNVIEQARYVPANGGEPPCTIIPIKDAFA